MDDEDVDRTACVIRMIVLIVGVVAAILAIVAVTIYARRALKEALRVRVLWLFHMVMWISFYVVYTASRVSSHLHDKYTVAVALRLTVSTRPRNT